LALGQLDAALKDYWKAGEVNTDKNSGAEADVLLRNEVFGEVGLKAIARKGLSIDGWHQSGCQSARFVISCGSAS